MKKTAALLTIVFAFGLVFFKTISGNEAAKCAVLSFEKEFEQADAVFSGRVLTVEKTGDVKIVEIEVERIWKGGVKRKTSVGFYETRRWQANFEAGGEYLVFAKTDDEGVLWDGRCSRTKRLSESSDDLEKLGAGRIPPENDNP